MGFKDRRPLVSRGIRYIIGTPGNSVAQTTARVIPSPGMAYIAPTTVAARVFKVENPKPGSIVDIFATMTTGGKGVSIQPRSTSTVKMKGRASNVIALSTAYGKGAQHVRLVGLTSTSYGVVVIASTR